MGKKRKQSEEREEDIRRKIRKLEKKLEKKPRRRIIEYSSDDEENYQQVLTDCTSVATSPREDRLRSMVIRMPEDAPPQPSTSRAVTPPPSTSTAAISVLENVPAENLTSLENCVDVELEEEILKLLGEAPKSNTALGKPIHKDVASRWQDVIMKGLTKEVKQSFSQEYLIPSNCEALVAPMLNLEVKAALTDVLVKRDASLMCRQKQLAVALSALGVAIELIIGNETSKQKVLKPISDACRLLCDSHYVDTKMRRNFVISAINTGLKETLIESSRDKYLFGENMSEKLKTAKSIQRSGEALKFNNIQKPKMNNFTPNINHKNRFNFKANQRKSYKDSANGPKSRPSQRQQPRGGHSKMPSARSPPRRAARRQ